MNYTTYSSRPSSPPVLNQAEPRSRWQQSGHHGIPVMIHEYHPSQPTSLGHQSPDSPHPNYTAYSARPSSPPVLNQAEPRRLPPPLSSSPDGDRWQQSGSYGMPAIHGYHPSEPTSFHSPSAHYPSNYPTYSGSSQGAAGLLRNFYD
ncbi:hypothetical protein BKA70DRAFT_1301247 [Coprinopsis sp. MPI-PUGE-AT-0042]|nr:hypothetical protein BKA70DRAFT_1301247 [Coprinopsis sp. MPI-PUGE-AT-0042]